MIARYGKVVQEMLHDGLLVVSGWDSKLHGIILVPMCIIRPCHVINVAAAGHWDKLYKRPWWREISGAPFISKLAQTFFEHVRARTSEKVQKAP
jgi:hypothetical protein